MGQTSLNPPLTDWKTAPYWAPAGTGTRAKASEHFGAFRPEAADPTPAPLVYVAVTPCRLVDTRTGSGLTGAFGPPSLAGDPSQTGNFARKVPVPTSPCGIPKAAAYSLN